MEINLSPLVRFFADQGVPLETILLLLMLPIIATLIAFLRQVVGIKAFGIYTKIGLQYGPEWQQL